MKSRVMVAAFWLVLCACGDDGVTPPEPPPPDTEPPIVTVVSPSDSGYDANGDGLVELRLAWAAGEVELGSVRVRAIDGIGDATDGAVDLLLAWRVERLDSTGLEVTETIENLLHPELSRIELSAADSAGNVWMDTVAIELPPMAWHRTIPLGPETSPYSADHCADDDRLYIAASGDILVLDGTTFELLARVETGAARVRCIPDHPYLIFSGADAGVLDRRTLEVRTSYANVIGLAWSALDPGHFYAGSSSFVENDILVFDATTGAFVELFRVPPDPIGYEFLTALAISDRARKIYVTKKEGVRVIDFDTRVAGDTLRQAGGLPFGSKDLKMSPDGRHLYAAVTDGQRRGLALFSVESDTALYTVETEGRPIRVAVSPSGQRVFVTTQWTEPGVMTDNYLFAAPGVYILDTFPRENITDDVRLDSAVAFRSDGKLLFNAYDYYDSANYRGFLDVYLNREYRPPGSPGAYAPD